MKCKVNNAARLIRNQGEQILRGEETKNVRREENRRETERMAVIGNLIPIMKQTAELAGFEVVGRIVLRDKRTGKEYR